MISEIVNMVEEYKSLVKDKILLFKFKSRYSLKQIALIDKALEQNVSASKDDCIQERKKRNQIFLDYFLYFKLFVDENQEFLKQEKGKLLQKNIELFQKEYPRFIQNNEFQTALSILECLEVLIGSVNSNDQ